MPSIIDLNELTQATFRKSLGSTQKQYLASRGITGAQIERFGIGYAPSSSRLISDILKSLHIPEQELLASGLVVKNADGQITDRFRNRIMFPIHSADGDLIAFGGRATSDDHSPKYLNSPETEVYSKRDTLYNLNRARREIEETGVVILVEGYMDVIGLDRAEVGNAVASCGTSLGQGHAELLREYATTAYLNFDSDEAGMKATYRAIFELTACGIDARVVRMPSRFKDPDEYTRKHGADGYYRLLESSQTFLDWGIEAGRVLFNNSTPDGRVAMLKWLMPLVKLTGDPSLAEHIGKQLGVPGKLAAACYAAERKGQIHSYSREEAQQGISLARLLEDRS